MLKILWNPNLETFEAHKQYCDYGPNGKTICPHCTKQHLKREIKQHQDECLEFYKFQTAELKKNVTKNENLVKNVKSLTQQIQELRASSDRKLQNLTKQNAELRHKLKEKTELLERNSIPNKTNVLQMATPPNGEINIFQDLKSRYRKNLCTKN